MSREPTVIYSAASTQQAHLLRSLLEDEGIAARVVNDAIQIAGGELPVGWTAAARVVVPRQDAAAARQLAEQFDRQERAESIEEQLLAAVGSPSWQWPLCPACGQHRSAQCPMCGEVGRDFPLADSQPSGGDLAPLVVCPSCTDAVQPQWYRTCAGCGHDYGSGIASALPRARWQINWLTVLLLAAPFVLAVLCGAYFLWLFG
jgi:hypothetical protein